MYDIKVQKNRFGATFPILWWTLCALINLPHFHFAVTTVVSFWFSYFIHHVSLSIIRSVGPSAIMLAAASHVCRPMMVQVYPMTATFSGPDADVQQASFWSSSNALLNQHTANSTGWGFTMNCLWFHETMTHYVTLGPLSHCLLCMCIFTVVKSKRMTDTLIESEASVLYTCIF